MKLHVKNFGPIREAKVEIRPMTVFVGHSNTGKSYLAMLVYSIAKAFGSADSRKLFLGMFPKITPTDMQMKAYIDESDVGKFLKDTGMRTVVGAGIASYLDHIRRVWAREASFCFGEGWKKLAKQKTFSLLITDEINGITLNLLSDKNDFKVPNIFVDKIMKMLETKLERRLKEKLVTASKRTSKGKKTSQPPIHIGIVAEIFDNNSSVSILNIIMDSLEFFPHTDKMLDDYHDKRKQNKVHYLPAGRGIVMENYILIANAVIHNLAAVHPDKPPFSGVIADFLQKLLFIKDFLSISDDEKKIAAFADKVEKRIVKGRIKVETSKADYCHFSYAPENVGQSGISLMGASSAVSELASVILFIRHYLSWGDIFIIEEPEANLHTVAQREIAALLVELVNAGVYVLITTHSDVIIEQISNCMQASRLPKGSKTKVLHNAKLSPEKISAYTFVERKIGTKVQLIPLDKEDPDILSDDHTDVSSDLYNESVRIYNSIQENGN